MRRSEDVAEEYLTDYAIQAEAACGPLSDDELLELAVDDFHSNRSRSPSPLKRRASDSSLGSWPESARAGPSTTPCLSLGWVLDRLEDQFQCAL